MSTREEILAKCRAAIKERFAQPSLDDMDPITWDDPVQQFKTALGKAGGRAVDVPSGSDICAVIKGLFPEASTFAGDAAVLPIVNINPDTIEEVRQKREEQLAKLLELELKQKNKTHFIRVYMAVRQDGKTVEQLIEEVDNKVSKFPRATRDFLKLLKPETIKRWIDEFDNYEVDSQKNKEKAAEEEAKKPKEEKQKTDESPVQEA